MSTLPSMQKLVLLIAFCAMAFYGGIHFSESATATSAAHSAHQPAPANPVKRVTSVSKRPDITSFNASEISVLPIRKILNKAAPKNLFAAYDWNPPPVVQIPPTQKPAPPVAPTAPPLPFSFVGLLEQQAKPTVFLAKGENLLLVSAGDVIDETYRVEVINANEIVFTYVPLKQKQSITIAGGL